MSSPDAIAARKTALRDRLVTARRRLGPPALRTAAEGLRDQVGSLPAVQRAATVAAYVAVGHEPGTGPLIEALHARGVRVLLPVVLPDLDLDWAAYAGPDRLVTARRGLLEPTGPRLGTGVVGTADVVLVPATAADATGARLGQGGGCYDRALARVPLGTPVIALLHDDEVVDEVPRAPHDRPVTAIATPQRVLLIDGGGAAAPRR